MQGGYLVVEILALLVETPHSAAGQDLPGQIMGDLGLPRLQQIHGYFQKIQQLAGIPIGGPNIPLAYFRRHGEVASPVTAFRIVEGLIDDGLQVFFRQRAQHIHAGAGQQSVVQLEGGILGGGSNEAESAILDMRQKGILLRLVETMHLVDEQQRAPAEFGLAAPGLRYLLADLLDPGQHGGKCREPGVGMMGDDTRQGGLARARRPPEDHRMQASAAYGLEQRFARGDQVLLADVFGQRAWPHPIRQGFPDSGAHRGNRQECPVPSGDG